MVRTMERKMLIMTTLSKVSTLYVHSRIFPRLLLHPELFATEHAHVRMLSVLQTVFSKPLEREELLSSTDVATIFPSLDEIIEVHCKCKSINSITSLYPSSWKKKQEVLTSPNVCFKQKFHVVLLAKKNFSAGRVAHLLFRLGVFFFLFIPDNFYENLKKLRVDDNFIVKSIRTTVLGRVSFFQSFSVPNSSFYYLEFSSNHSSDL